MNREPVDGMLEASKAAEPGVVARLVEFSPGRLVAFPPHTTLEIVENPQAVAVPGMSAHGFGLLAWQGDWIALIDLETLVGNPDLGLSSRKSPRYALVLAYQRRPGSPVEHGAIGMNALPESVTVRDKATCELANDSDAWPLIAISCFRHEGKTVPIVDTGRLFGRV